MELKINENLKKLRRDRGNTQDDLANFLGISVQAVSKWERGDGFPDITLLPYIASYYEVTVDEILGCSALRKQEELDDFKAKAQVLLNQGKRMERLELCRAMLKKYPHEVAVLYEMMYDLYSVDAVKNSEEIISTATTVMEKGTLDMRYGAIQMLAYTYSRLGNDEKAIEYAKMVPCNKDLLSSVLKGKDLVEHCRWYFWQICDTMQRLSFNMMQCPEAEYTAEERHTIREKMYQIFHIVYEDGDFGFFEERLAGLCRDMALSSAEMGMTDRAFEELQRMCDHAEKYERFSVIDHTSLLVRGLHYDDAQSGRSCEESYACGILRVLEKNPRFKSIRDDERLEAIKARLKAIE